MIEAFGEEYETVEEFLRQFCNEVWKIGETENGFEYIADQDDWDGGEDRYSGKVFKELATGKLYLVTGYYSSWEGTEWEDVSEVQAVTKTVIVYEAI